MWCSLSYHDFTCERFRKETNQLLDDILSLTELKASHKWHETMEVKYSNDHIFRKLNNMEVYCANVLKGVQWVMFSPETT